jgi:GAF domain-containing protein
MSVVIGPEDAPWGTLGVQARCRRELTLDDTHFILAVNNVLWEAIRRKEVQAEPRRAAMRAAGAIRIAETGSRS